MTTLGPRILHYVAADGSKGDVQILLCRRDDMIVDLGDGDTISQSTFGVEITCDWFTWKHDFPASDDLQSIFLCMWMSDIYVQKICTDNDVEVYSLVRGDVTSPMDIFKK